MHHKTKFIVFAPRRLQGGQLVLYPAGNAPVSGDLGGVTDYEDPMLISFYIERGTLESFEIPRGDATWAAFNHRQTFQVHTPDTMWTLPGQITSVREACAD